MSTAIIKHFDEMCQFGATWTTTWVPGSCTRPCREPPHRCSGTDAEDRGITDLSSEQQQQQQQ